MFFKQKTAYAMRISDWSSDVCSSDLASKGSDPRKEFDLPRMVSSPIGASFFTEDRSSCKAAVILRLPIKVNSTSLPFNFSGQMQVATNCGCRNSSYGASLNFEPEPNE